MNSIPTLFAWNSTPTGKGGEPLRQVMTRGDLLIGAMNAYGYTATVSSGRPSTDFTPRIVPFHSAASAPLEAQQILWYR